MPTNAPACSPSTSVSSNSMFKSSSSSIGIDSLAARTILVFPPKINVHGPCTKQRDDLSCTLCLNVPHKHTVYAVRASYDGCPRCKCEIDQWQASQQRQGGLSTSSFLTERQLCLDSRSSGCGRCQSRKGQAGNSNLRKGRGNPPFDGAHGTRSHTARV